jgi:hypothetical protein
MFEKLITNSSRYSKRWPYEVVPPVSLAKRARADNGNSDVKKIYLKKLPAKKMAGSFCFYRYADFI